LKRQYYLQVKPTLVLFLDEVVHVAWRDAVEKVDVLVRMELSHLSLGGGFRALL
jgi:hypothetical protein